MSMGLGSGSTVEVAVDGATKTFASLGRLSGGTLDWKTATADMTNNDSGGYTEFLYTDTTINLSADVKYDPADAVQTSLMTYVNSKTDGTSTFLTCRVRPIVGSGFEQWVFRALVTDFSIAFRHGEGVVATFNFIGTVTATTPGTPITPVVTVQ
jgi:hypothetical protein